MRILSRAVSAVVPLVLLAEVHAIAGTQSVLDAAGTSARHAERLWWGISGTLTVIYVLLAALLVLIIVRRSTRDDRGHTMPPPDSPPERRYAKIITTSTIATAVLLVVFLVVSLSVGHAVVQLSSSPDVNMKITGHQWWWEIEYVDPVASNTFVTANEFHIPVGKTVDLQLL